MAARAAFPVSRRAAAVLLRTAAAPLSRRAAPTHLPRAGTPLPLTLSRRMLSAGVTREEILALEARVRDLEAIAGKVVHLEAVAAGLEGRVRYVEQVQGSQGMAIWYLATTTMIEARNASTRFAELQKYHYQMLVKSGTLSFNVVVGVAGAAATLGLGLMQVLNAKSETAQDRKVDDRLAQRTKKLEEDFVSKLDVTVQRSVDTAMAKAALTARNDTGPPPPPPPPSGPPPPPPPSGPPPEP